MKSEAKLIISICLGLAVVVVCGISFAYYVAKVNGAESVSTISGKTGKIEITFSGGTNQINMEQYIEPSNTVAFATKTITITQTYNNTSKKTPYDLHIIVDQNEFNAGSIVYTVESTNTSYNGAIIATNLTQTPVTNDTTVGSGAYFSPALLNVSVSHKYVLKFYYPETDTDQSNEMNKAFRAHAKIIVGKAY